MNRLETAHVIFLRAALPRRAAHSAVTVPDGVDRSVGRLVALRAAQRLADLGGRVRASHVRDMAKKGRIRDWWARAAKELD